MLSPFFAIWGHSSPLSIVSTAAALVAIVTTVALVVGARQQTTTNQIEEKKEKEEEKKSVKTEKNRSIDFSSASTTTTRTTTMAEKMKAGKDNSPSCSGRVVRLHFACRAELPMGTILRVTSDALSLLSSPSHAAANAKSNTAAAVGDSPQLPHSPPHYHSPHHHDDDDSQQNYYQPHAFSSSEKHGGQRKGDGSTGAGGGGGTAVAAAAAWSSSTTVEMVTCPSTYPIWRTRHPVVTVLSSSQSSEKDVWQYRYRYVAVTPGADSHYIQHSTDNNNTDNNNDNNNNTTSADNDDAVMDIDNDNETPPIVMWENPFHVYPHKKNTADDVASDDGVAGDDDDDDAASDLNAPKQEHPTTVPVMPPKLSSGGSTTSTLISSQNSDIVDGTGAPSSPMLHVADLPFRTLNIDMASARPIHKPSTTTTTKHGQTQTTTDDGITIDTWNYAKDSTFRPYLELLENQQIRSAENSRIPSHADSTDALQSLSHPITEQPPINYTHTTTTTTTSTPDTTTTAPAEKQRMIFVCYHLPVSIRRDPNKKWIASWNESILAKTNKSIIARTHDAYWFGTISQSVFSSSDMSFTNEDLNEIKKLLASMNCTPLFFDDDIREAHYYGMCKQVLWPAFHNVNFVDIQQSGFSDVTDVSTTTTNEEKGTYEKEEKSQLESSWDQSRLWGWWNAYKSVNQYFLDALSPIVRHGDIVWVHDYHLSLLPALLDDWEVIKYGRSMTKKIFYLHIPFPPSRALQELECGEEVLCGMLKANVVGFHSFDHARHFLNASKRILGLDYDSLPGGMIGLRYGGQTVLVTMHNVSVEPDRVDAAMALPSVKAGTEEIKARHSGRSIIAGVDIAQGLSGVSLKFLAYERLLTEYPTWQDRVVLVQKCLISGSRKADEERTLRELRHLVRRIQSQFGPNVVDYEEIHASSSLPIERRLALWMAADVMMNAPIREGLNLLPLEYVYARKESDDPGVTIASEFSTVRTILNGALRVNPFDVQMTARCIDTALSMEQEERQGRLARDIGFVSSSPSSKWAKDIIWDLVEITGTTDDAMDDDSYGDDDDDDDDFIGVENKARGRRGVSSDDDVGMETSEFLEHEYKQSFSRVNVPDVVGAYQSTKRRVIILDFNGTLVIKEPPGKYLKRDILGTSGNKPPAEVLDALKALCADPHNTVYVVSGDSKENVVQAIGSIPGLGLAASNGACFSPPLQEGEAERKWNQFDLGVDWEAVKRVAVPVLNKFTSRTNGSWVKLTHSSLGWSFYSCDPEWGALQASHLVSELEDALQDFDVRFVLLKGIIEIVPRRLNKGIIVKKVLREAAAKDPDAGVDFILCMGDDISDEQMFTSVLSFISEVGEDAQNLKPSPPVIGDTVVPPPAVPPPTPAPPTTASSSDDDVGNQKKTSDENPLFAFTIAVGKKHSHASQYVHDATDVAKLLVNLSGGDEPSGQQMKKWQAGATTQFA